MTKPSIDSIAQTWNVTIDGAPIETTEGLVVYGLQDGKQVCLKTLGTSFDAEGSLAALEHYRGRGSVSVLMSSPDVILMERLKPGTTLEKRIEIDDTLDDVEVFCEVAAVLHGTGMTCDEIPAVHTWSRTFSEWNEDQDRLLTRDHIDHANALYQDLALSDSPRVVLHGDLHHGNILFDDDHGWLAIDPKGAVGDPAFEAAAFLRNPMSRLDEMAEPTLIKTRIDGICARMGWSPSRVTAWAYCQNVLSAVWDARAGEDVRPLVRLVDTLKALL